jgi:hypothetical protein
MVCDHKCFGERVWLPFHYNGMDKELKSHPCCSKCGLVKNVSCDRLRPIGHYLNILRSMAKAHSIINVQIKLISLDLNCLEDLYRFDRHQQNEIFKETILKFTKISG